MPSRRFRSRSSGAYKNGYARRVNELINIERLDDHVINQIPARMALSEILWNSELSQSEMGTEFG